MISPEAYLASAARLALAGTGTFLREQPADAGLDTGAQPAPFIVLSDYTTAQARPDSRTNGAQLTVYFADSRPGEGDDPEAHAAAVARMETLRRRFLSALDSQPLVQLDGIRATPFASAYAAELDGVGCQFTLTVPAAPLLAGCL